MIGLADSRYDTSQLGGTFYDTYADALSLLTGHTVTAATLVLDAGWDGDQVLTLGNVSVNGNTFAPQSSSSLTPTCNLPPATLQLSRLTPTVTGSIDEVAIQQNADTGNSFRVVDCKYMFNLAAKSLGTGQYKAEVLFNNVPATGFGTFTLK